MAAESREQISKKCRPEPESECECNNIGLLCNGHSNAIMKRPYEVEEVPTLGSCPGPTQVGERCKHASSLPEGIINRCHHGCDHSFHSDECTDNAMETRES